MVYKVCKTLAFVFMVFIKHGYGQDICDRSDEPTPIWKDGWQCTYESFEQISTPPLVDDSVESECSTLIMTDLDQRLTTVDDFEHIRSFINDTIQICMDRGVGYVTNIVPLFNMLNTTTTCCSKKNCDDVTKSLGYSSFVGLYDHLDPVHAEDQSFEDYMMEQISHQFNGMGYQCLYNNVLLITNRLFNTSDVFQLNLRTEDDFACATLTIVVVGRTQSEISELLALQTYGGLTKNIFVVQNYSCLANLESCIKPCGSRIAEACFIETYDQCNARSTTLKPITAQPTEQPTTNYWHVIYVFAMSNYTTKDDLVKLNDFVMQPITHCTNCGTNVTIEFIAKDSFDSGWITNASLFHNFIPNFKELEILLSPAEEQADTVEDNLTVLLMTRAASITVQQSSEVQHKNGKPALILLTDFASEPFIRTFEDATPLTAELLMKFEFTTYLFTDKAVTRYEQSMIKYVNDANYTLSQPPALCNDKNAFGASFLVLMVILLRIGQL